MPLYCGFDLHSFIGRRGVSAGKAQVEAVQQLEP